MTPIKRAICDQCLRPQNTCICRWITPTEHAIEVLFLQHPLEIANPKGSARLLHLSLPGSLLITGEVFSEEALQALLYAPFDNSDKGKTIQPLLLYPDTSEDGRIAKSLAFILPASSAATQYRLIVLDGTWRKSRKMLYSNPLLQQLPRLPLSDPPASHYRIRKALKPDQLSSYEATCHALMTLENETEKYQPLLTAFDGFVEQIGAYGPKTKESTS